VNKCSDYQHDCAWLEARFSFFSSTKGPILFFLFKDLVVVVDPDWNDVAFLDLKMAKNLS